MKSRCSSSRLFSLVAAFAALMRDRMVVGFSAGLKDRHDFNCSRASYFSDRSDHWRQIEKPSSLPFLSWWIAIPTCSQRSRSSTQDSGSSASVSAISSFDRPTGSRASGSSSSASGLSAAGSDDAPQVETRLAATCGPTPRSRRKTSNQRSQVYGLPVSGWIEGGRTTCFPVPKSSISQSRFLTSLPFCLSNTILKVCETASLPERNGLSVTK